MNYSIASLYNGTNLTGLDECGFIPYYYNTTSTCIGNTCVNTENSNELKINVKKHQIKFNFNL